MSIANPDVIVRFQPLDARLPPGIQEATVRRFTQVSGRDQRAAIIEGERGAADVRLRRGVAAPGQVVPPVGMPVGMPLPAAPAGWVPPP